MIRVTRSYGLALVLVASSAAVAREWTDEIFATKVTAGRPFIAVDSHDPAHAHGVIG